MRLDTSCPHMQLQHSTCKETCHPGYSWDRKGYGEINNDTKSSKNSQDVLRTSLDVDPQIACQDELFKTQQTNQAKRAS